MKTEELFKYVIDKTGTYGYSNQRDGTGIYEEYDDFHSIEECLFIWDEKNQDDQIEFL